MSSKASAPIHGLTTLRRPGRKLSGSRQVDTQSRQLQLLWQATRGKAPMVFRPELSAPMKLEAQSYVVETKAGNEVSHSGWSTKIASLEINDLVGVGWPKSLLQMKLL
ncbi:hypothetical protein PIB30_080981 [Stylosanthes scabra]|uniref:Uncharacterized protein n=1 Tax=Stylosanthes scabra TaxID=79078 RepID=A0ABU6YP71_9FABA|nr:hypothetical protein [Stylosanthes scabra]